MQYPLKSIDFSCALLLKISTSTFFSIARDPSFVSVMSFAWLFHNFNWILEDVVESSRVTSRRCHLSVAFTWNEVRNYWFNVSNYDILTSYIDISTFMCSYGFEEPCGFMNM